MFPVHFRSMSFKPLSKRYVHVSSLPPNAAEEKRSVLARCALQLSSSAMLFSRTKECIFSQSGLLLLNIFYARPLRPTQILFLLLFCIFFRACQFWKKIHLKGLLKSPSTITKSFAWLVFLKAWKKIIKMHPSMFYGSKYWYFSGLFSEITFHVN
jgi:hypothetical protein